MIADSFLDTNILVYAVVADESVADKRTQALELVDNTRFALSAQVLQEFFVTVTRKLEAPLTTEQALEWIEQWEVFPCVPVDTALVKVAAEISERYRISYWDGAILAATEAAGAATLYTEDLNHGQEYNAGIEVINPFE